MGAAVPRGHPRELVTEILRWQGGTAREPEESDGRCDQLPPQPSGPDRTAWHGHFTAPARRASESTGWGPLLAASLAYVAHPLLHEFPALVDFLLYPLAPACRGAAWIGVHALPAVRALINDGPVLGCGFARGSRGNLSERAAEHGAEGGSDHGGTPAIVFVDERARTGTQGSPSRRRPDTSAVVTTGPCVGLVIRKAADLTCLPCGARSAVPACRNP